MNLQDIMKAIQDMISLNEFCLENNVDAYEVNLMLIDAGKKDYETELSLYIESVKTEGHKRLISNTTATGNVQNLKYLDDFLSQITEKNSQIKVNNHIFKNVKKLQKREKYDSKYDVWTYFIDVWESMTEKTVMIYLNEFFRDEDYKKIKEHMQKK